MRFGEQLASFKPNEEGLAVIRRQSNIRSYGVIKGIMGSSIVDTLPLRVRCECSIPICEEIIEVTLAQRRELRRRYPRGFIVVLLHVSSPNDTTLSDSNGFKVVQKDGISEMVTDL